MKIVLDACVPQLFRNEIEGHEVYTSHYLELNLLEDAELLDAIDFNYDVLVTCDRGIPWQNQFRGRQAAVIVLRAPTNKLQDLTKLVPALLKALEEIEPGEVREVSVGEL